MDLGEYEYVLKKRTKNWNKNGICPYSFICLSLFCGWLLVKTNNFNWIETKTHTHTHSVAGAMGICFPYLGEFQPTKYRLDREYYYLYNEYGWDVKERMLFRNTLRRMRMWEITKKNRQKELLYEVGILEELPKLNWGFSSVFEDIFLAPSLAWVPKNTSQNVEFWSPHLFCFKAPVILIRHWGAFLPR